LYSADHYSFWKSNYPNLDWQWGMFGENLTVIGLDESEIRIGDQLQVGDAVVQVSQPRQPCFKLGVRFGSQEVVSDFWELPYPGVYVRVLSEGSVKTGDEITLLKRDNDSLAVSQVFSIFRSNSENMDLIRKAIAEPYLANSCRRDIKKLIE
jgi:MOSC domain-containing protein YiiM